jgi:hypothetical protein
MAIEPFYRAIRAQTRKLERRDSLAVMWAYSQFLQVNDFRIPADISSRATVHRRPSEAILAG